MFVTGLFGLTKMHFCICRLLVSDLYEHLICFRRERQQKDQRLFMVLQGNNLGAGERERGKRKKRKPS